jgi:dUTP pyrophosphatase
MTLEFFKIRDVKSPSYGTSKAAGLDFYVPNDYEAFYLEPGESRLIPSGIKLKMPQSRGYTFNNYALIAFNKSGVSIKKNLQVGASVVDSDYAGELHLHLYNYSNNKRIDIEPGEKIVQFVLIPIINPEIKEVFSNPWEDTHTERGEGMAGSTGTK